MIRLLWAGLLALLTICLTLLVIQFACFYAILQIPEEPISADLIAVFIGSDGRVQKGYEIANRCKASYLTLSPASISQIGAYSQRYNKKPCFQIIVEDRADTTFQNALLVSHLAHAEQLRSVILVTSAVHMPRSYLMMRIYHLGSGLSVFPAPVEGLEFSKWPWQWSRRQQKWVYNEMVEFWGSLAEMVNYWWSGELPEKSFKQSPVVAFLERSAAV